jgi:hypothetical protein
MPHDLMKRCEVRRQFLVNGYKEWRWKEVPVSQAVGRASSDIRCMHCHGPVRVHQQQVAHGPEDHVEHRSRKDSEGCRGGIYFKGEPHQMSAKPVT